MSTYPFTLEALNYDYTALEPVIDEQTMHLHHDKHHQTYLDNLNKLISEKPELQGKSLEELLSVEPGSVKNNAGGVWNHNFFFGLMVAPNSSVLSEVVKAKLTEGFGGVEQFMAAFEAGALGRFGSGWVWLVKNAEGKLAVVSTANQDNPIAEGLKPILTLDVWEHAYYLKYQNRRSEYAKAFWQVVNWQVVESLI